MKKTMASLSIFVLGIGAISNAAAWTDNKQQLKAYPHLLSQTINEDAEDIANKLWNKTIKIDPNVFLGKNLQTDKDQFNATLVKNGILTQDEAQYVSWGNLNINIAGWYWNKGIFTVTKDGATATGHVTVDADAGESPAIIATKIAKATNIKFNYSWWNNKAVQNYLPELRNILINEHILTKVEAYTITGFSSDFTINNKTGLFKIKVIVNDNNTSADAWAHINVVDDGSDAQQIASEINGYGLGLKINTAGMYADSNYVTNNFRNLLVGNYGRNAEDMEYVTLPHIKLAIDNPNTTAQVIKDGQIATAKVDLECKPNPYIYYYIVYTDYLQVYVNLCPNYVQSLKTYFSNHSNQNNLSYFYNMLCNGSDPYLASYSGSRYLPSFDQLNKNLDTIGKGPMDTPDNIVEQETETSKTGIATFGQALVDNVLGANGYLSLMFEWTWSQPSYDIYTTTKYFFW